MVPAPPQHHHRPTLSQSNKVFKSKHASKGTLKEVAKGRIVRSSPKQASYTKTSLAGQKAARRNHAKQLQAQKRQALVDAQRVFFGESKAPRVVSVLGLCEDLDCAALEGAVKGLEAAGGKGYMQDGDELMAPSMQTLRFGLKSVQLLSSHSKSSGSLQFLLLPHDIPLPHVLSAVLGSDFLLAVFSPLHECSPWGETCLRSLQAAGTASGVVGLVSTLEPVAPKDQPKTRASLLSFLHYFFPPATSTGHGLLLDKVVRVDVPAEAGNVLRCLTKRAPREVKWREGRGRLVAEDVEWQGGEVEEGTLTVTGVVRGGTFSANRLVHLPLAGDFAVSAITAAPLSSLPFKSGSNLMDTDNSSTTPGAVLSRRDDTLADDLVATNTPSEGDRGVAEQTWPTEGEIATAPANFAGAKGALLPPADSSTTLKIVKRVPKGTSAYQAAWLLDDDEEEDWSDDDEILNFDMAVDGADAEAASVEGGFDDEEYEDLGFAASDATSSHTTAAKAVTFTDLSDDVEASQLASHRERLAALRSEEGFPDEIDTPQGVPARVRFARYRGLKSFRTSTWDPYEDLPADYGKVFAFENWRAMGKKLLRKANEEKGSVQPGTRVTLHIEGVSRTAGVATVNSPFPVVIMALLRHEHKVSVMHFTTQRNTEYCEPVKSKDPLILVVGPRFFFARPLWSQHTQRGGGKGENNVHKFERFLRPGAEASVGTAYLPVTFGNMPVLVLKDGTADGKAGMHLVGSATLLGSDVTRVIAKRIILTGHPYKVHKKTATIRYMFFNRSDIEYFKPIQLKTKKGRLGHISAPLGTHGYFKAGFDGPIDQMDTVCMSLYKRCFPKWGEEWAPRRITEEAQNDADIMVS